MFRRFLNDRGDDWYWSPWHWRIELGERKGGNLEGVSLRLSNAQYAQRITEDEFSRIEELRGQGELEDLTLDDLYLFWKAGLIVYSPDLPILWIAIGFFIWLGMVLPFFRLIGGAFGGWDGNPFLLLTLLFGVPLVSTMLLMRSLFNWYYKGEWLFDESLSFVRAACVGCLTGWGLWWLILFVLYLLSWKWLSHTVSFSLAMSFWLLPVFCLLLNGVAMQSVLRLVGRHPYRQWTYPWGEGLGLRWGGWGEAPRRKPCLEYCRNQFDALVMSKIRRLY